MRRSGVCAETQYLEVAGPDMSHLLQVHRRLLKHTFECLSELLVSCTNVWVFFVVWVVGDGPALKLEGRPLQRALPADTA